MRWMALVSVVALLAMGCGDDEDVGNSAGGGGSSGAAGAAGTSGGSGGAGPLVGEAHPDCDVLSSLCGLPFPSNYYLADDPTKLNPSGKRVQFGATTLPPYAKGKKGSQPIDPAQFYGQDGFSPGQGPLYFLPGATLTGVPTSETIPESLKADTSPTILMDAETGELVPHFTELDRASTSPDPAEQVLIIRPVVRLKDRTRYIVAIRNIVDGSGQPIAPVAAFQALRDRTPTDQNAIESRRADYEGIFAALGKAGVKRDNLQIAWDYTTATRENNTQRLLHMRDDALAKVGDAGPTYTIKAVETADISDKLKARVVLGMKVPLYLDSPDPGGKFVLDDKGLPKQNGEAEFEVLLIIPKSLDTLDKVGLLANGHGLLGDKREGQGGYLAEMCNRHGYIGVAVDFIGFAEGDVPEVLTTLGGDLTHWSGIIDRQHQGHLNGQLAMRMLRGRIATEGLKADDGTVLIPPGKIDPAKAFYRGDSQGGIMGTVYMAISKDVTRGLLGELGMPYNLLLNRSVDYAGYDAIMKGYFPLMWQRQIVLGLLQMEWDRTEPNGYAPYINKDLLPGTPSHEVLMHVAIGDYQVPPLGAHIIARSVGAKNLAPVNRSLFGLPEDKGPFTGSGLVEYDFALKDSPINKGPVGPKSQDPHDTVRKMDESYDQSHHFFQTGEIKAFCDGTCDCQEVLASTLLGDDNKASCKAAAGQ